MIEEKELREIGFLKIQCGFDNFLNKYELHSSDRREIYIAERNGKFSIEYLLASDANPIVKFNLKINTIPELKKAIEDSMGLSKVMV